jgi:hypothetical protein
MTPPRDLLPGNVDLADIAAGFPPGRRSSSWDVALMATISVVLVVAVSIVTQQFERLYQELGLTVSRQTGVAVQWWFHALALVMLAVPCAWRFHFGKGSWATHVWFLLAIAYVGFVLFALFMPLMIMIEQVGEPATSEHR